MKSIPTPHVQRQEDSGAGSGTVPEIIVASDSLVVAGFFGFAFHSVQLFF
jgi:hypothetical protein